jgi:hypothetical protein
LTPFTSKPDLAVLPTVVTNIILLTSRGLVFYEWLVTREIFTVDELGETLGAVGSEKIDDILIWFFARRTGAQLKALIRWPEMTLRVPHYIDNGNVVALEWILQQQQFTFDIAVLNRKCCVLMDHHGRKNPNFFGIADVLVRCTKVCPKHNLQHILLNAKPWYNLLTIVVAGRRRKMTLPVELWRYIVTEYSVFTPDEPLPPFDQWWKRQI